MVDAMLIVGVVAFLTFGYLVVRFFREPKQGANIPLISHIWRKKEIYFNFKNKTHGRFRYSLPSGNKGKIDVYYSSGLMGRKKSVDRGIDPSEMTSFKNMESGEEYMIVGTKPDWLTMEQAEAILGENRRRRRESEWLGNIIAELLQTRKSSVLSILAKENLAGYESFRKDLLGAPRGMPLERQVVQRMDERKPQDGGGAPPIPKPPTT